MVSWEERITESSDPSIQIEHQLRYQLALPLIEQAALWCDLGCGNGVAAKNALAGKTYTNQIVFVDLEQSALEQAKRNFSGKNVNAFTADLSESEALKKIRETLLAQPAPRVITCFEAVEHLQRFTPLIELFHELAQYEDTTIVLSVPNDAFWAIENPHHLTAWGEGAFAELLTLLPKEHTVAHQVSLTGSAILLEQTQEPLLTQQPAFSYAGIPTHFLVSFGKRHRDLQPISGSTQADLTAQRTWVRQREANLALTESAVEELEKYRAYIHELEDRLELPRSGEQAQVKQ